MIQLQRSLDSVRDIIAQNGLKLLQSVLRESGFEKSEYLKDYELYAHVDGDEIIYEIALSMESVEEEDLPSEDDISKARQRAIKAYEDKFDAAAFRSYGLAKDGRVHRISTLRDVRKKSHDTKITPRDARKKSRDTKRDAKVREFEHMAAAAAPRSLGAPRSMEIGRSGKLKLSFTRKFRKTSAGYQYPKKDFEGIMDKFVTELQSAIAKNFVPELEKVLSRYTT